MDLFHIRHKTNINGTNIKSKYKCFQLIIYSDHPPHPQQGFTTKNKVTVKSVVKPVKKTVKVKKTAKRLKIKVKLKGKKVLKNKRVYLKIKSTTSKKGIAKSKVSKTKTKAKIYKAKTNKKGIATFKVPKKVIKKLKKGKKYQAIFTYKAKANGKTIQNTAKCNIKVR